MKQILSISPRITTNLVILAIFCAFLNDSFCQQVVKPFQCADVRVNDYIRNVSDCRGWIRCKANGTIASGFCPEPYYFNELSQKCIADNSHCFSCQDSPTIYNEYLENSCNRFIRCIKKVATEQICQDGLQFNPTTGQCDHEANVQCTKNFTCSVNVPAGEFYAVHDTANCSIGMICFGERVPMIRQCGPDLHFIKETGNCGFPVNSGCDVGIVNEENSINNVYSYCIT